MAGVGVSLLQRKGERERDLSKQKLLTNFYWLEKQFFFSKFFLIWIDDRQEVWMSEGSSVSGIFLFLISNENKL